MSRNVLSSIVGLVFLVIADPAAGQNGELSELSEVSVVVEKLGNSAKELGIHPESIQSHVLGVLQTKVPHLSVDKEAPSVIYVSINLGLFKVGGEEKGYYGAVFLEVFRRVTISETSRVIPASVWSLNSRLLGSRKDAVTRVQRDLEILIAQFAKDWYRDNPPG